MDDPAEPPVSNRQPPAAGDGTWVPIPVTVGKATTYIDRPLRPDGYLDYLEAARRLGRAGVTAETNAAVLIFLAIGSSHIDAEFREEYFRRLDMPTPPADGDYFVDMKEFAASRDIDIGYDEDRALIATTYDREWTREDSSLVADWLAANESPLSLFAEASRRSHFHLPLVAKETDNALDQVVPPPFTPIRGAVRALRQRAMLHVGEGRLRDAEADLLTIHRLADLLRQGTTWTTSLVGTAFQGIACEGDVVLAYYGQPTSSEAAAYRAELEQVRPAIDLVTIVDVGMRRFELARTCRLLRQGPPENSREKLLELGLEGIDIQFPQNQQDADAELEACNTRFDAVLTALRRPTFAERREALQALARLADGGVLDATMSRLFSQLLEMNDTDTDAQTEEVPPTPAEEALGLIAGAVGSLHEADARSESQLRMVRLLLALAAYRNDQGDFPDRLSALSPKYVNRVPADAFDERPFLYRREDEGFILYTAGPNGKDDGGWDPAGIRAEDDWPQIRVPISDKESF